MERHLQEAWIIDYKVKIFDYRADIDNSNGRRIVSMD